MIDLRVGDVAPMHGCTVQYDNLSLTYKADKKNRMVFLFLGSEPRDGSKPLDSVAVLKAMGWNPSPALKKALEEEARLHDECLTNHAS